jgi:hypothetical protein
VGAPERAITCGWCISLCRIRACEVIIVKAVGSQWYRLRGGQSTQSTIHHTTLSLSFTRLEPHFGLLPQRALASSFPQCLLSKAETSTSLSRASVCCGIEMLTPKKPTVSYYTVVTSIPEVRPVRHRPNPASQPARALTMIHHHRNSFRRLSAALRPLRSCRRAPSFLRWPRRSLYIIRIRVGPSHCITHASVVPATD